jgi:hypothetical protein
LIPSIVLLSAICTAHMSFSTQSDKINIATFQPTHDILMSSLNTVLSALSKKPNRLSEFSVLW